MSAHCGQDLLHLSLSGCFYLAVEPFLYETAVACVSASGILVLNAREGGPAWRAGIRGTSRDEYGRLVLGDIITAINGSKVRNSSDLYRLLDKSVVSVACLQLVLSATATLCACQ